MSLASLTDDDLHALRARVSGSVIGAADDGFDLARAVWNGRVDGGIVLDLGDLTSVDVAPDRQTVHVQAGATSEHVDAATAPHGLAVPIGVVSGTGVAGLTLGVGLGWLTRTHGLTADNLLAVELVAGPVAERYRPPSAVFRPR